MIYTSASLVLFHIHTCFLKMVSALEIKYPGLRLSEEFDLKGSIANYILSMLALLKKRLVF